MNLGRGRTNPFQRTASPAARLVMAPASQQQPGFGARRVMFLVSGMSQGGAETQLAHVARELVRRDWQVAVISFLAPRQFTEDLQDSGVQVYTLGIRRSTPGLKTVVKLVAIVRQWKPDVLVGFMFHGIMAARLLGRVFRRPVVVSSIRNEKDRPWRERLLRITDGLSGATLANSRLVARTLVRRSVVTRKRIRVVPNALVSPAGRQTANERFVLRSAMSLQDGDFLWLAAGRLEPQKDYDLLLNAFAAVANDRGDAQLRIAGEGPLASELATLINGLGLSGRAQLLGRRRDISAVMDAADALVLSSAWEGLPNVVMEAMAAGKPVVATMVGGVPELVQDGVSGFLVPAGKSDPLAGAMRRMMELSVEGRSSLGHAGREHIRSHFDADAVVDQWESLFLGLLAQKGTTVNEPGAVDKPSP